jgi:CBS domain-containing protein
MYRPHIFRNRKLLVRQIIAAFFVLLIGTVLFVLVALGILPFIKNQETVIAVSFVLIFPLLLFTHICLNRKKYFIKINTASKEDRISSLDVFPLTETVEKKDVTRKKHVRDIMTRALIYLSPTDTVQKAIKVMQEKGVHSVLVSPPRGGRIWQIFTETDFLIAINSGNDPSQLHVGDYSSPVRMQANPNWTLDELKQHMISTNSTEVPVTDDEGNFIGLIGKRELLRG